MKKTIALSLVLYSLQTYAMDQPPPATLTKSQSLCKKLCERLRAAFPFTAFKANDDTPNPLDQSHLAIFQPFNRIQLDPLETPSQKKSALSLLYTKAWNRVLSFLTPHELLQLAQTNSQILKSIQSAPAINHKLCLQQTSGIFYDYTNQFSKLVFQGKPASLLMQRLSAPQRTRYCIAKGCTNITPVVLDYEAMLKTLKTTEKVNEVVFSSNIFLVGSTPLLQKPLLYPRTLAIGSWLSDIKIELPFQRLKHVNFSVGLSSIDKNDIKALRLIPCLTYLLIRQVAGHHPNDFLISQLAQKSPSFPNLQEFVYGTWDPTSEVCIETPQGILKSVLSAMSFHAPNLKRLRFPAHILSNASAISEAINSFKKLETLQFAGATGQSFAILDYLSPTVQEIIMPFEDEKQEYYDSTDDLDFAHAKTTRFLNERTNLKICDLKIFPDDLERHFDGLFQGSQKQENLQSFACHICSIETMRYLINALPYWDNLKDLTLRVSFEKKSTYNQEMYDALIQALQKSSLFKKPYRDSSVLSLRPPLLKEISKSLYIQCNNLKFVNYMTENFLKTKALSDPNPEVPSESPSAIQKKFYQKIENLDYFVDVRIIFKKIPKSEIPVLWYFYED